MPVSPIFSGGGALDYGYVYFQGDGTILGSKYITGIATGGVGLWTANIDPTSPIAGALPNPAQLLISTSTQSAVFGAVCNVRFSAPNVVDMQIFRGDNSALFDPAEIRLVILPLP